MKSIADWFQENGSILHHLKYIEIQYMVSMRLKFYPDYSEPIILLQRLVNMLFDDHLWESHRMRIERLEDNPWPSWNQSFGVKLVKASVDAVCTQVAGKLVLQSLTHSQSDSICLGLIHSLTFQQNSREMGQRCRHHNRVIPFVVRQLEEHESSTES